ncbi:MAG: tetratricopeptide repeat protein [Patescibacteria group bacterium]
MINDKENQFYKTFLQSWHPFFWIAFTILLVYSATLFFNVVYLDDNVLVTSQYQFNKDLSNIPKAFSEDIFRTPYNGGTFYRPLERLTFVLDAQFGERAVVFMSHFSNILLHILASCLLFWFLFKFNLKKEVAFLLTLIFSIHPLTAQTVAFIAGRNDSLLAIFIFLSLIYFLNFIQNQKKKDFIWHFIFLALALLTKETAAVLPIICAIYVLIFIGWKKIIEDYKTYLKLGAGYVGIVVAWFLIRISVLHNFIGNADYNILLSIYKNLPSLIPAIGKIFLPLNLSVFPVIKDMTFFYGIISLFLLAIWFILSEKKNLKLIVFGFSWFLTFILLTLIKPVNMVPEFSENRIYLPMFGFIFVILGLGMIKLPIFIKEKINYEINWKKIILSIGLLMILIFSSVTIYRNQYYKNGFSFWKNAVETSPSFAFNHNNLGAMYYLDGNVNNAEKEFKTALELNPKEPMAHNNLGLVYANQNKLAEAEEEYKKELENNPYYDNAYYNLGLLYWKEKRYEEALSNWKKILEINPNFQLPPEILQLLQPNK